MNWLLLQYLAIDASNVGVAVLSTARTEVLELDMAELFKSGSWDNSVVCVHHPCQ